ncbi:unnamed protein product [Leuciscus chuanchicus]
MSQRGRALRPIELNWNETEGDMNECVKINLTATGKARRESRVDDSVLSVGRFETQMAGALVQSSLEEVINRFIHFSSNPSSDSISIPAAINPNASSSTAVHPKCI